MTARFNRYLCELAGVDRITPENRDSILEKLSYPSGREITEQSGVESAHNYLSLLRRDPYSTIKSFLKTMYDVAQRHENRITTSREIYDLLGTSSTPWFAKYEFLELMGVIKISRTFSSVGWGHISSRSQMEVNVDLMKKYWPDIENWSTKYSKLIKREKSSRANHDEIQSQILEILGKKSKEELTEADLGNIYSLSKTDWRLKELTPVSTTTTINNWSRRLGQYVLDKSKNCKQSRE